MASISLNAQTYSHTPSTLSIKPYAGIKIPITPDEASIINDTLLIIRTYNLEAVGVSTLPNLQWPALINQTAYLIALATEATGYTGKTIATPFKSEHALEAEMVEAGSTTQVYAFDTYAPRTQGYYGDPLQNYWNKLR